MIEVTSRIIRNKDWGVKDQWYLWASRDGVRRTGGVHGIHREVEMQRKSPERSAAPGRLGRYHTASGMHGSQGTYRTHGGGLEEPARTHGIHGICEMNRTHAEGLSKSTDFRL